jgi:2-polyprenyl-6-hydroxyphenyl methylase/3-demethylubiquinone-9 3-methyltransferase
MAASDEVFRQIDNRLYDASGDIWWQPDSFLHLLRTSVNPARVSYFRRLLEQDLNLDPRGRAALEVGCGGGILCEEIARMGFDTSGVDPSEPSLETARGHARASGVTIRYERGTGEALPYPAGSFDAVFCCDVLEHVRDLSRVASEIARVLKPGGIFFFDTINRTFVSWLVAIKVWQEWKRYAFMAPKTHVWKMFIRPDELKAALGVKGLAIKEFKGISPNASIPTLLSHLRKRASGAWTFEDLGRALKLIESDDLKISYMGYAMRQGPRTG